MSNKDEPLQPSPWDDDTEDTLPSLPIPAELRARLGASQPEPEPTEVVRYRSYDQETLSQQDEISTPPPLTPAPGITLETPRPRSSTAMRLVVGFCLFISLASLVVSGLLIYNLVKARNAATDGLDSAMAALDNLAEQGFHYEYKFEQVIPFSGDIPFKQDLVFPFEGDIPINTTIEVPLKIGSQTLVVRVPINTSVYVDTAVPVSIDQTVHVSTSLPISLTIPIDVKADDPKIQELLGNVRQWLLQFRESF